MIRNRIPIMLLSLRSLNESRETEYRICHMLTPAQAAAAGQKSAASASF
jgi:hypothetical protein